MRRCPHRPPCPGCPRFAEPGIDPQVRALLDQIAGDHGLPSVAVTGGVAEASRLRARLAIRGRRDQPKLGLFEAGTHRIVTIPSCSVQHPLINQVAAEVRHALVETGVPPYSDLAHAGLARYLQVVVERGSQAAQVVLVGNTPDAQALAACLDRIRERLGDRLHSLWFNAQTLRGNAVLGADFTHWHGPRAVIEHFGGPAIHFPPGAFGQGNLDMAERIIDDLRAWIPPGASVAEFYAGVGAIGLSLLGGIGELRLNEVSPGSLAGLELGREALPDELRARTRVFAGPAEVHPDMLDGADVVIVDPPRRGLDPALRERLAMRPPARLLYVSCGPEAFARDASLLTGTGSLRLVRLTAYDQMPWTGHVETVGVFERH
jgi:tRNA/tmRNA/rRNA uracil-C5-methylase (TrmA/RlmC/RlmD family)